MSPHQTDRHHFDRQIVYARPVFIFLGLLDGTFAGGVGLAYLGDLNRRFAAQIDFFSRINATMQVDQGLAESLRLFLEELATTFSTEEALLLYRDTDLERIFLWRLKAGERDRKSTRLNSSHVAISYAVFCLKKKKTNTK